MIEVVTLTGSAVAPRLASLAALRVRVFRDFPYLYDGAGADPSPQPAQFSPSGLGGLVVALDGDVAVGCATALPSADEPVTLAPLQARGCDPATVCYFGESVLLPAYRGRGLGVRFFAAREAHAASLPGVSRVCFCAVRRPPDHPLRPAGYQPLDAFWRHRGFRPWPGPPLVMSWKQVDGPDNVGNELDFWVKDLRV